LKARDLIVKPCLFKDVRAFIEKHHYSKSVNGVKVSQCFTVQHEEKLVGAVLYGAMSTTAWKKFAAKESEVVELRRLVLLDEAPKNSESKTVGATLRWFEQNSPETKLVISYADPAHGHSGVIYKAANFQYLGTSAKDTGWYDPTSGKTYHSRALRTKDSHGRYKPFVLRLRELQTSGVLQQVVLPGKHCYVYRLKNKPHRIKNSATIQTRCRDADHIAVLTPHPVNRKHDMDLNILFENIGSIATSLERIADSLEQRSTITVSAAGDTVTTEAPKRKRRTKAEIEADEAARIAAIGTEAPVAPSFVEPAPAVHIEPVVVPPVIAAPVIVPPAPVAAPVVAAPVVAAPPVVVPPAPVVAPVSSDVCGPEYAGFAPQLQFAELTKLVGPYWGNPFVQTHFVALLEQLKLQLPLASVADRNEPRDEYKALPSEHRHWLYTSTVALIEQLKNAGAQPASI
jgi:hypothetical protein